MRVASLRAARRSISPRASPVGDAEDPEIDGAADGVVDGEGRVDLQERGFGRADKVGRGDVDFVQQDDVGAGDLAQALSDAPAGAFRRGVVFFHLLRGGYRCFLREREKERGRP